MTSPRLGVQATPQDSPTSLTPPPRGKASGARQRRRARVSALVLAAGLLLALVGPWLAPHDPGATVDIPYASPSGETPLGTDHLGADVLSRVLSGGRGLILSACGVLVAAYLLGAVAGMLAALRRGWVDSVLMRTADLLMSMPAFILLSVLVVAVGRGPVGVAVATAVILVPDIARMVRAATAQALEHDYVEAAQARGERTPSILSRELLPNLLPLLCADAGVRFVAAVFTIATAAFLGYGTQPPEADWALMLLENQPGLALQPLAVLAPAVLLLAILVSANMLVDRLTPGVRQPTGPADEHRHTPAQTAVPATTSHHGEVLAQARGLCVASASGHVLHEVDVDVAPGQILALVGESGSGKTTLALALLGGFRPGLTHTRGELTLSGSKLHTLGPRALRSLRARNTAYVPQDPRTALSPTMRIGTHLAELLRAAEVPAAERTTRAREALRLVDLPDDDAFLRRWPHQLSGGQRQRVALAGALAPRPGLLVMDEPTSALDPVTAAALLRDLSTLRDRTGVGILLVTHDLAAAARAADRVLLMAHGRIVEAGTVSDVLDQPVSEPGRKLAETALVAHSAFRELSGATEGDSAVVRTTEREAPETGPLLRVRGLRAGHSRQGPAVLRELDLDVPRAGCLTVVGPSGSGKSTLLRCLAGLHPEWHGELLLSGKAVPHAVGDRTRETLRTLQFVPQDPFDSLNPAHTVDEILRRPLRLFAPAGRLPAPHAPEELLARVDLPSSTAGRPPSALSGGQRQRVALARALAARPEVLLCDEITSALDAATAASMVKLLASLRSEDGMTLVVVTHDLSVAARLGGDIAVLRNGEVCEFGPVARVLTAPAHPATRGMLDASLARQLDRRGSPLRTADQKGG